jgi:ribonuclease BN (tRNA processing enzyme)
MKIIKSLFMAAMMASVSGAVIADDGHSKKTAFQKVEGELSVMVLGSGGPIATAEGRASAGYLIFTDGKPRILMDVGGGTFQRLAKSGTNIRDLDIILLSHLHADHTGDLTPIVKTIYFHNLNAGTSRSNPINIYGPGSSTLPQDNTGKVTYPNGTLVYPSSADYVDGHFSIGKGGVERYLTAFVGGISGQQSSFAYTANDLNSTVPGASEQVFLSEPDGLVIKSIAVDHGPVPAVAFRIEYKGHTVVYSGDTGTKGIGPNHFGQGNMATISAGADMLIYDTAVMEMGDAPPNPLFHTLHTQPSLIANVAISAGVKTLVLSHLTPVTSPRVDEVKDIIRNAGFTGKIKEAKDLKVYNLGDDD